MTSKIQEEIKDLEKELKKYYPHTPEANIIRYKISQTKKCIEMFKEMIDKWAYENHIYRYRDITKDITDLSQAFCNHMEVKDIEELKSQLDEVRA